MAEDVCLSYKMNSRLLPHSSASKILSCICKMVCILANLAFYVILNPSAVSHMKQKSSAQLFTSFILILNFQGIIHL